MRTQVLVVGAGPVGMATALALLDRGIDVQIVDSQWRPGVHSYALALHARVAERLRELAPEVNPGQRGWAVERISVWDSHGQKGVLDLRQLGGPQAGLFIMPQSLLEQSLEAALRRKGREVLWNHQFRGFDVSNQGVRAEVERLEKQSQGYPVAHTEWSVAESIIFDADVLIGADGHQSTVRRQLAIQALPGGAALPFAVFEISLDSPVDGELVLVFGPGTLDARWPVGKGRVRWSFQLPSLPLGSEARKKERVFRPWSPEELPQLAGEELSKLRAERAPWCADHSREVHWRVAVVFQPFLAESWGHDRTWLLGDAAHVAGPWGMQSMNAGILEGLDWAEEAVKSLRGKSSWDKVEDRMKIHQASWRRLLGLSGRWVAGPPTPDWLAPSAPRLGMSLPATPPIWDQIATGCGLHWEQSGI